MSANFVFQPKPEGDRHIQVHISHKRITDGKESTAALLSVLEYLAKQSLLNAGSWSIGDPIPEHIRIQGDCNNPRLNRLLDGWLQPTALRGKLQYLDGLGSKKCGLTPQKVESHPSLSEASAGFTPQKVDPSRSLTPDLLAIRREASRSTR